MRAIIQKCCPRSLDECVNTHVLSKRSASELSGERQAAHTFTVEVDSGDLLLLQQPQPRRARASASRALVTWPLVA